MLLASSGTGKYFSKSAKVIRFTRKGCTNRPFFHIVVTERRKNQDQPVIEQLGTYDPLPNEWNEKLTSLNYERIRHWISHGAHVSKPVEQLLGLAGFFPIHPTSYMVAWRNRNLARESEAKENVDQEETNNS